VNLAAQYAKDVLEGEKAKAAADSTALGVVSHRGHKWGFSF
jgi:hypothetical protein